MSLGKLSLEHTQIVSVYNSPRQVARTPLERGDLRTWQGLRTIYDLTFHPETPSLRANFLAKPAPIRRAPNEGYRRATRVPAGKCTNGGRPKPGNRIEWWLIKRYPFTGDDDRESNPRLLLLRS